MRVGGGTFANGSVRMWQMVRGLGRSYGKFEDMDKLFSTLKYQWNSDEIQRENVGDRPIEGEMRTLRM